MKSKSLAAYIVIIFTAFLLSGCSDTAKRTSVTVQQEVINTEMADVVLPVNTNISRIEWIGKKVTGQHNGTIDIKAGELFLSDGNLKGGNFVIDMNTITVLDLTNPESNAKLTGHLKSDDFFSAETFPEGVFEITELAEEPDDKGNTHSVSGNLTIKGITKNITFPAYIEISDQNVTARADFDIDRTEWDVRYGSGKFFDNLGDNMINDHFNIKFNLVTE